MLEAKLKNQSDDFSTMQTQLKNAKEKAQQLEKANKKLKEERKTYD